MRPKCDIGGRPLREGFGVRRRNPYQNKDDNFQDVIWMKQKKSLQGRGFNAAKSGGDIADLTSRLSVRYENGYGPK
jgi:hypothetical protein